MSPVTSIMMASRALPRARAILQPRLIVNVPVTNAQQRGFRGTAVTTDGSGRAGSGGGEEARGGPGTGGKGASNSLIWGSVGAGFLTLVFFYYRGAMNTPASAAGPPGGSVGSGKTGPGPHVTDSPDTEARSGSGPSIGGSPVQPNAGSKGPEGDPTQTPDKPRAGTKLEQRYDYGKKAWTSTDEAKSSNRPRDSKPDHVDDSWIRDEQGNPVKKIKSAAAIPNTQKTAKRVDGRTENN